MKHKYSLIFITFLCAVLSGYGQTTVTYDFSAGGAVTGLDEASPGISLDTNIGFGSFKNSGTSNPGIFSGQLRLYQNATKGGSIVIYPLNGATITSVIVNASGTTGTAGYTVDSGSATNLNAGSTYAMTGINATSVVEFYQRGSTRVYVDDFEVTYTMPSAGPTITATPTTINTGLDYSLGNGPSTEQSFDVEGSLLTDNIEIAQPTDFEISTGTGAAFNAGIIDPVVLTQSGGTVASTTIYVRLKSGLAINNYNETITATSTGATDVDIDLEGEVITPPPANDDCSGAISLIPNASCTFVSYTNVNATDSGVTALSCQNNSGLDVWFSVTIPASGEITVETSENGGLTDTAIGIYSGVCGSLSQIACNDDGGTGFMSLATISGRTPGEVVFVRVADFGGDTFGTFDICVTTPTACAVPSNQPTGLTLTNITGSSIDGSFTATTADEYLVVVSTSATLGANPVNGVSYVNGNTIGSGTVVQSSNATTFTATGLAQTTPYYFFVFALNDSSCAGGPIYNSTNPLNGNATTLSGPCLSELNFTSTPSGWAETNISYASNEANFGSQTGELTTISLSNPASLTFDLRRSGNTTAKTLYVEISTTTQGGTYTTIATYDHSNTTASSTTICTIDLSAYTSNSTVFIKFRKASSTTSPWYMKNVEVFCGPAGPEIEIQGNSTEIAHGDITPDTGDHTDFGNVAVTGGLQAYTYTILNTGGADLDITSIASSNNTEFAISGVTLGTIPASSFTTFIVTFDPSAIGTRTSTITVISDDADEATYTFAVAGNGTNSNLSSIVDNTNYSGTTPEFNSNPEYINFINGTSTATGKFIPMKLRILDGPDTDGFGTTLTDLSITVEDISNSNQLAMIKTAVVTTIGGTVIVTATKVGNELVFSGMSGAFVTANDDDVAGQIIHIRASFDENQVVDKTKLIFKVTSATADASGSSFAATDAGGAETDTGSNARNRLNVAADRLTFTTQPSNTSVSVNMAPSPVVSLTDLYGNTDLDIVSGTVAIASTGTPGTQPSATISTGQAVFSTINHSAAGGPFTLTASYSGWTVVSNPFNISNTANGSYRTTGSGNWLSNNASPAIWQRFDGSNWNTSNSPSYNTSNNVYIRNGHTITSGGSWGSSVNMIINSGGTFNVNHSGTAGNLTINDGGNVNINANLSINSSGTLEVLDNGNLHVNYQYGNPVTSLWQGTEIFHPNSNFILNNWDGAADVLLDDNTSISTNTFNGYTAVFGNVISDFGSSLGASDDMTYLKSGININLAHGNFIFRSNDPSLACGSANKFRISTTGTVTSGIGGDFIVEDGFTFSGCYNQINFKTSGTLNFTIGGDMILDQATTNIGAGTNPTITINIEGDLLILGGANLNMQSTIASGSVQTINLKGDYYATNSGNLNATNTNVANNIFNFLGTGDGLTAATTQTIDVANTSGIEHRNIEFFVKGGAYVQLINRDFELGRNGKLTVENNAILNFGFDGTTALNVAISGSQTGTNFESETGSTLIITSPDGISTTGNIGNVRTVASNRTFNQTATFWYIGKQNQVTGNALSIGSSVKNVYANLFTNDLELRLTNRTGISDGGKLEIQQGIVIGEEAGPLDTDDRDFYGDDGVLIMTGGEYRISTITANPLSPTNGLLPKLRKFSSYSLTGGTVHLNGDNAIQMLSGVPTYFNLAYSGVNTLAQGAPLPPLPYNYKGISSAVNIVNNVTMSEDAIVDVENNTFGGSTTNLIMEDNSRYVTAGSGTKPDATGSYTFGPNTTIEFNNNSGLEEVRLSNPVPAYANIVVSGSDVGTLALGTGANSFIQFQPGGSFTVTETGTFKLANSFGFSGSGNTSISSTNNPAIILDDESTVEYLGGDQIITALTNNAFPTNLYYANVTISGTGLKTLGHPTDVFVGEDLNMVASTLTINTNEAITVDEGVIVTGGDLNIEDSGSLVQVNDVDTNSGPITMKRDASIKKLDYVYWSSPVEGYSLNDIYGTGTPLNRIYRWNPTFANTNGTQGNWVSAAGETMQRGVGYIVRGPDAFNTTNTNITATFNNGKPFNGLFTVNVSRGTTVGDDDQWNLIGNPYPSAVNALDFLTNSTNASVIDGFVNIWTHGNLPSNVTVDPFYDNFGSNYTANDYITHNGTGTTSGPLGFNGEIAAGQSFMVNMLDFGATTKPIEFRNIMRDKANDNSQFYRNNQSEEKHRIWLDLVSETAGTTRVLVGYIEGATQQRDRLFDAITDNQNFYSLISDEKFIIQGRQLPFTDTDIIPLGVNITAQGNQTIAIAAIDGLFENANQTIFIKDNLLNYTHNLNNIPYSFTSEAGTFNDRFEIVFRDSALSVDDYVISNTNLAIIELADNNVKFSIGSNQATIKSVEIIDMLGRTLYKFKGATNTETYNLSNLSSATYIAKVTLSNNQVLVKKAVKK